MTIKNLIAKISLNKETFSNSVFRRKILYCEYVKMANGQSKGYEIERIHERLNDVKNGLCILFHNIEGMHGEEIIKELKNNHIKGFQLELGIMPRDLGVQYLHTRYSEWTKAKILYIANQISLYLSNIHH